MRYADGSVITVDTETSPLLERVSGEIYHCRKIVLPDNSAQTADWRYTVRRGGRDRERILVIKRKLKVLIFSGVFLLLQHKSSFKVAKTDP